MKLAASFTRSLQADMRAELRDIERAASNGTRDWATLFVNATGSFIIGLYATLTGPEERLFAGPKQRQFVMTGICGGYTTFSVFSLETLRLLHAGNLPAAGINIGVSVLAWLAAVWAGHTIATGLNRLKGS